MSLAGMAARHAARNRINRFEEVRPAQPTNAEIVGEFEREPWDRNIPDPGKSIPITPELLAEEARKEQEREAARDQLTWQRPVPLPEASYRKRRPAPSRRPSKPAGAATSRQKVQAMPAAPPTSRTTQPRLTRRKPMPTNFTIKPAIDEKQMPSTRYFVGRVSPYLSLYEALQKLVEGKAPPVGVDGIKGGTAIQQALRKMAIRDKKALISRRDEDGKTFYFQLTDAPKDGK